MLAGLPPEVQDAEHDKHSTAGVRQWPKVEFNTIFLLTEGLYYFCSICGRAPFFRH
jgi:hypothetical protein